MHAGSVLKLAGYELHFVGVERVPGPNFTANRSTVEITRGGQLVAVVHPEQRFFPLQQQTTSETAIRTNFLADLYIALGDGDTGGQLDAARLLEAAGAVDLDRRDHHGVRRHGQPERSPLAGRRRGARPPRAAPVLQPAPGD